ncbi:unnamed protein product [Caenorhabditis sp. 36 PRJEB53466]|nr:unnamed protein product [Caenorhabditis sp. 36 PRJEB53466]
MLSAVASTSSLVTCLPSSTSSPSSTQMRRKHSENATESLYRKWSHLGTPPRSSASIAAIPLRATLSMSAKDRAKKFSERIASWVSMSICECFE